MGKLSESIKTILYIALAVFSICGAMASLGITYNKVSEHDVQFDEFSEQLSEFDDKIVLLKEAENNEIKALLENINRLANKIDVLIVRVDALTEENHELNQEIRELRNRP